MSHRAWSARFLLCGLAAALVAGVGPSGQQSNTPVQSRKPNVVLFLLDDATSEDIQYMPNVQSLLVSQGATFDHNYSSFPLCCPARASILTGQYPHNHRVLSDIRPFGGFKAFDDKTTIATWLNHDYHTALVGKYLNDYKEGRYVPPGWDSWQAVIPPFTYRYTNIKMNINGVLHAYPKGYATNIYGRKILRFVSRTRQPFFLYASYVAPHNGSPHEPDDPVLKTPYVAPKYRNSYTGPGQPLDASFNEADVSDKPADIQQLPLLTPDQVAQVGQVIAQRREALRSVDDNIADVISKLAAKRELHNTYIVLTSDNGYMNGQHRIVQGKRVLYEPSARVPLIIRGPGIQPGSHYSGVSGLQDIAPTILDMTNERRDQPLPSIDGRSLLPLLSGTKHTNRVELLERVKTDNYSDVKIDAGKVKSKITGITWVNRGMVTPRGWKYIDYPTTGEVEMYNLRKDPYELQNLAGDPAYRDKQAQLARRLARFKHCDGAQCR